jgi:uncharacterized protein YbjT (DUF2867 family)
VGIVTAMLVITTPTGQIGQRLLTNLLDSGERLRVIVRDPTKLPVAAQNHPNVETIAGSHNDPTLLDAVLDGADGLFWLVPPDFTTTDVIAYYRDFTRPAADAITRHQVSHVVAVSTLGRDNTVNAGHLTAALEMDAILEATPAAYRSLRPPFFMENLLNQAALIKDQGIFSLPSDPQRHLPVVATRDIAATATQLLIHRTWDGHKGVPVHSPDNLTPNTMATVLSEVLERPVRFEQMSLADYGSMMQSHGASPATAQGLVEMAAAQNRGFYDTEPAGTSAGGPQERPAGSTSLRSWTTEALKPNE